MSGPANPRDCKPPPSGVAVAARLHCGQWARVVWPLLTATRGFLIAYNRVPYAASIGFTLATGETMMRRSLILAGVLALVACAHPQNPDSNANSTGNSSASLGAGPPLRPPAPSPARKYDGPFGLQAGLSIDEVKKSAPDLVETQEQPGWYSTTTVPTPHPSFESYGLQFSAKSGLCRLTGVGKNISTGSDGSEVRSQFDDLTSAITERYGHGKKYDFYTGGGSGEPQYWMMYLKDKDQVLGMAWEKDTGAKLPPTISSIVVRASALDMRTGIVYIMYNFSNIGDCTSEEKASKNKAL